MPAPLIARPYRPADQTAMQALLRAFPSPFESYPTADELPELLRPADPDILVWDRAGELAGFAIVDQYHNLIHCFRPGDLPDAVEREMMAWAEDCIRARREPITLDASAHSDDAEKASFLQRHGFRLTDVQSLFMARPLAGPLPAPQLPPGLALRPLAGESEVAAYVALHRAAYGTTHMTVAERLTIMHEPAYRLDLDLVAVAPDGALAAFCICFIDEAAAGAHEGDLALVGVHPAYRGLGLGRAMVLAGMRALQTRGVTTATLGVASNNQAAVRVYESLGFRTRFARQWYEKPIQPA